MAATCDYAEASRRETAIRFILDAFNGKVDAILARVKADNAGTLAQQIGDSFEIVNRHGEAFRDARITSEYLNARLAELKWAALANHLKAQERDEQRRVKEQAREEERVRRETDRAEILIGGRLRQRHAGRCCAFVPSQRGLVTVTESIGSLLRADDLRRKIASWRPLLAADRNGYIGASNREDERRIDRFHALFHYRRGCTAGRITVARATSGGGQRHERD